MNFNSIVRSSSIAAAVGVLAFSGQALASAHPGSGHSSGGSHASGGSSRAAAGFSVGFSSHRSGFSAGFGDRRGFFGARPFLGSRGFRGPVFFGGGFYGDGFCGYPVFTAGYSTCWPESYYADDYVVGQPVFVNRPVLVQRDVIVDAPPAPQIEVPSDQVYAQASVPQPTAPPVASAARPAAPARTEQPSYRHRELGDAYLRMGDPDNAIRTYSKYLSAWNGDGTATRNLGFAQIEKGDVQEGFRAVARGYTLEPNMAERPLTIDELGGKIAFQRILDGAAHGAAANNTAEAWLTVSILQNVAGQKDVAINALQKSRDAGLDKNLLDSFTLELSKQK